MLQPLSLIAFLNSHYATIQGIEPYMTNDQIKLSFSDGMMLSRMEALFEGKSHAATLFGGPHYFAEQLGYRNESAWNGHTRLAVDCVYAGWRRVVQSRRNLRERELVTVSSNK
jgi:hypothetical protein